MRKCAIKSREIKGFVDIKKDSEGTFSFRIVTKDGLKFPNKAPRLYIEDIDRLSLVRLVIKYRKSIKEDSL